MTIMYQKPSARCVFISPRQHAGVIADKSTMDSLRKQLMGTTIHCDSIISVDTHSGKQCFLIASVWDHRNIDRNASCECMEARITRTTQFFIFWSPPVVIKPLRVGLCHQRGVDGLVAVYQDVSLGEELLRLLDEPVALVLCGALQAYFQTSSPMTTTNARATTRTAGGANSSSSNGNSLLVTAPAGTGSVELVIAAAHRMVVTPPYWNPDPSSTNPDP